ncbi:MAG: amino acid adenylation domain-containing protein [Bacteroidales bacterium]|nr:amino acid adenylation domain-containing protein [Bacteroidales bacterium]
MSTPRTTKNDIPVSQETALRLTLAVWNAETEGWTPETPIKDVLESIGRQEGPAEVPVEWPDDMKSRFADSVAACLKSMEKAETFGDLAFATQAQIDEVEGFNPPPFDFDPDVTLIDIFRQHVEKNPGNPAVVSGSVLLSYAALDELTDRLAAYISGIVRPGGVVSIILERNEYMMAAPLAVLKAGCAYQPLDPSYPSERLNFMVKDASSALLIADPGLEKLVNEFEGPVLSTSGIRQLPQGKPDVPAPKPDDRFILLYTSGTTGVPKGVQLSHRNVSVFGRNNSRALGIGPDSRTAAYASFGFDASMGDLSTAIASGAALYIIPDEIRLDLVALDRFFTDNHITHLLMTTQVATQFAINFPANPSLQVLYTGGEKLSSFAPPKYRLVNVYGPTEATCYTVSKTVSVQVADVPIGKPLPGVRAYIVGKGGQRLPVGAAGELLLSGYQVGLGYLGRPDKTAESFIDNPFTDDQAYRHMYRTGDIVRYLPDGDIQFVGRKDMQVKIRGFRIELKEVESVIREFPGISDTTVQAFDEQEPGAGKFLAAYVVSDSAVDIDALNAFIIERKPPYMVPSVTMQIDRIPLNVNQKVDRKALPEPVAPKKKEKPAAAAAPLNILEQELAALIKETVHLEGFAIDEPLISCGLTSLSALRLATELYKKYGVSVDMRTFVKTATLQSIENEILTALIAGKTPGSDSEESAGEGPVPLTFQQKGLYFECMKAPHETVYNLPMCWTLPSDLNPEKVREAFLEVVRCHPVLMTRFDMSSGEVKLVPCGKEPEVEVRTIPEHELGDFKAAFLKPFNLSEGPLFRAAVYRTESGLYLLTDFHHLVFDGRSLDVFMPEFCAAVEGTGPRPETFSYFDYAAAQKAFEESPEFTSAETFFREKMAGFESPAAIIPDREKGEKAGVTASIVKPLVTDVAARCVALGISPASYCLAAAYVTLGAFCGSSKVYMCTVSNGRSDLRVSDTVGMFVNTLALAGEIGNGDVAGFLRKVDSDFSESRTHEYYPFARVSSDFGFQPQVMLAYQVGLLEEYGIGGRTLGCEDLAGETPMFPVSIFVNGVEGPESLLIQYDETLYSPELMQSFADAMETVMRGLLADGPLEAVPLVDGAVLANLDGFNHFSQEVDTSQTIVSLFRAQAGATPDSLAVAYGNTTLTYRQLDQVSDRIASDISRRGLGREDVVSILIGRSELMAVTALGALKAGCAYQPLDPSYPTERLNFMVQDASAGLLIAEKGLRGLLTDYKGDVLFTEDIASLPEGPLPEGPAPDSLFILLYTSGSTGVPKGCMLEHRHLVNFCAWYRRYYDLRPESRVAAYASFGFDACMMDLYPALTSGASVHIIDEDTRHDMSELSSYITDNHITHSFMTTQVGVMFARNFPVNPALKHLSVGGEKLVSIDPPAYGFHNGYGPTECTIFTTIFDVKEKEPNIPIGHPLDNVRLYVVDASGRRLPAGAAGELWISGPQVGRGYLNRPDKTAETFIANPFATEPPYDRVYRTGDIVRWRADGNIEFVGRNDGQVKIRGFRVETKEVEAVIREFPGVKDVTVQAFDAPSGGKFIAAYIVCEDKLDTKALTAFITERKPPYMVPASFNQLSYIPLNVNQKVDRKALPAPVMATNGDYVSPEGPVEKAICEVFGDVLGIEHVGATDNFFDLGGSSLMVTNVLVNAEKRGLRFSYADVFVKPTARSLAAFLGGQEVTEDGGNEGASEVDDVTIYDYSAIDRLLAGNTLEAFRSGEPNSLGTNILLTGATGFLGIHVLKELLESTDRKTVIWCLLRGKGAITAERRLAEMLVYYFEKNYRQLIGKRIRVIEGDITDSAVFDSLMAAGTPIDTVFNCAANVKHFSRGDDIFKVNYCGVKNLVDYCMARGARLVQTSTISVGGMTDKPEPEVLSEQMLFFGQNTDNQYVVSKFLAERLILEKVSEGSLRAKIVRLGNLSPRAVDGEFQVNFNSNASMGRLRAYRMLGACPYSLFESRMEFSPIDETARAVVVLAGTPDANVVFHAQNDHLLPMDDIVSRLKKDDGSPLDYVEDDEFARRMEEAGNDPEKSRILSSLIAYDQAEGQVRMIENTASSGFSMQILHRLGFRWSETASNYVDMIFEMLSTMQYFNV